jgi:NADPH:quinone reductase
MRAAEVVALEGPSGVMVHDVGPPPVPKPGEVLIDVHVVGLGYPDLLMSQGRYQVRPDLPYILGVDFAGTVREAQAEFRTGDRVVGWSTYGSAAEVVAIDGDRVFPLPDALSFEQGAAMPLNYLTAHFALTTRGRVQDGECVVVTGAAGGVGSAAVQVAAGLGARVIAVVTTDSEAEFARAAGAHDVVLGLEPEFVRDLTCGRGADVVLDVIGSDDVVLASLRSLAVGGRLLTLGYVAGEIPSVRLNRLLLNNLDVCGVAWGPWTRTHPGFARRQWEAVAALVEGGAIWPDVRDIRELGEVAEAMTAMLERRSVGKTVLRIR